MGLALDLIRADAYIWIIKYNKLHHVCTPVEAKDEDTYSRVMLRFAFFLKKSIYLSDTPFKIT